MKNYPFVSVVLPAYNAETTISESIQSIIDQTYKSWELIVINDGSIDNTKSKILSFKDSRIKYIENDGNKGLIYTLNRGIDLAMGKYIARMDADDICMPERFEKQVAFMEENPKVIVCGTYMKKFGMEKGICTYKLKDSDIKNSYLSHTCFGHPSVMINRKLLNQSGKRYDSNFKNAEDAKLWLDLMPFGEFANLPEPLLMYRISVSQCTNYGHIEMAESTKKCCTAYLKEKIGIDLFNDYVKNGVSVRFLKLVKKKNETKQILAALYMNMECFDIRTFLYYIVSSDFLIDTSCIKSVLNRFIGRTQRRF